jgi:hypothetical protein
MFSYRQFVARVFIQCYYQFFLSPEIGPNMLRTSFIIFGLVFCTLTCFAQDRVTYQPNTKDFTVTLQSYKISKPLPAGTPNDPGFDNPFDQNGYNSGIELLLMIQGKHLVENPFVEIEITKFQSKSGQNLLIPKKSNDNQANTFDDRLRVSRLGALATVKVFGKYAEIKSTDELLLTGNIPLKVAKIKEIYSSPAVNIKKPSKLKLGDFTIELQGEAKAEGLGFSIDKEDKSTTEAKEIIVKIQMTKNQSGSELNTKIKDFGLFIDNKMLSPQSYFGSDTDGEYRYASPKADQGIIKLAVWKEIQDLNIPFSLPTNMK